MIKVMVFVGMGSSRVIRIEGHPTCKAATAYRTDDGGWKINVDDGAVLSANSLRNIETEVLNYLKGSEK